MGIKDLFKRNQKPALPNAEITVQKAKIEEQQKIMESQQEQIEAIVAKVKSVASEVRDNKNQIKKMQEEQNKCISTYTRYEPSKISENENNGLRIRRLSKQSDYNYIVTLNFSKDRENDEIVLGKFNSGNLKVINEKFEELLSFQENLQYGGIEQDVIDENFNKLKAYAEDNEITITDEGEKVLTNLKNEPINIPKTVLYIGDKNTIERIHVTSNKDILQDVDNYSTDELSEMRPVDAVISEVVKLNKKENIDEIIKESKEDIKKYFKKNPDIKKIYSKMHRESIEVDVFLNAIKYFNEQDKNFESTNEYKYMKLYSLGETEKAENFYKLYKIDISDKRVKISKNDDRDKIKKKFDINRLLSYKHKQNTIGLNQDENNIYDKFIDSIEPDENYEIINNSRRKEKMFLAGIIDRMKTEVIEDNTPEIKKYNELLRRQDFDDRINYEISEDDDEQR